MMPVPVRRSEFVSLRDEDRDWNIEVDLGAIGAYGAMADAPDPRAILFADLQLNPDTMVHARLGAGRAGIYLDRYVKGVGRTSLAGNWANPGDVVHHTGHLRTSNALREYLITAYLDAKGKGHLVNRCLGILVKPLSASLRQHLAENVSGLEGFDETKPNPWSGDWHLQALTVKDARFSRFSNLVWLASSLDFYHANKHSGTSFTRFIRGFLSTTAPDLPADDATPEAVASAFFDAVDRGFSTLGEFWRLGISWGSLHNNFCIDGRYHDLEWPIVTGKPLVGLFGKKRFEALDIPKVQALTGLLEPLAYVMHMRMLAWFFRGRFKAISMMGLPVSRPERDFARAISEAFLRQGKKHLLFSQRKIVGMLLGWVRSAGERPAAEMAAIEATLRTIYRGHFRHEHASVPVRAVDVPLARRGLIQNHVPHAFGCVGDTDILSEEARLLNDTFARLDQIGDVDAFLEAVGAAADEIRRSCSASVPIVGAA